MQKPSRWKPYSRSKRNAHEGLRITQIAVQVDLANRLIVSVGIVKQKYGLHFLVYHVNVPS